VPQEPDLTRLSAEEARRAIFVAFEGARNEAPAVVGVLTETDFIQFVCDRSLMPAAAEKDLPLLDFVDVAEVIGGRCQSENRHLVAESAEILSTINRLGPFDLSERCVDGLQFVSTWAAGSHPELKLRDPLKLADLLPLVSFPRASALGNQKSAKRLRAVRTMIERKGSYEELTGTVKGQWTKLLKHNETACRGLQAVVAAAAADDGG